MKQPDLNQIDLVVRDMDVTIAFYRALGVEIPEAAIWRRRPVPITSTSRCPGI